MPPEKPRTIWLRALGQLELFQQRVGAFVSQLGADAEVGGMKNQNLARRQRKIQVRALRHHADQQLDPRLFFPHIVLADPGLARSWTHARGQHSDRGGFSRAVRSEQAENLSRQNFQRKSVEGRNLGLGLLAALGIGARNKASRSP